MSTFKKIITLKSYWKSVLGLSVAFIVVYNLIMAAFDGFSFTALITKATEEAEEQARLNMLGNTGSE